MAENEKKTENAFDDIPPMAVPTEDVVEFKDLLKQSDRNKWRYCGPTKMRVSAKEAMQRGRDAVKMECSCWNEHCPFHGNCRKCIVFHMSQKQFPTCQRAMLTELHLNNELDEELHIRRDENGNPMPEPNWDEMWANGVRPGLFPPKE